MRKTLILPLLMAAVLAMPAAASGGGGGHGAKKEGAKSESGKEGSKKEDKKKDDKKQAVHKITQSESYLMVDPIYSSIFDGNRPMGMLMVGIGIDVPDKELRDRVEREMPRLRDSYVRALMNFSATNVRSWRQPDVVAMADRLQVVTDKLLGKKGARILLAQVAIRLNK